MSGERSEVRRGIKCEERCEKGRMVRRLQKKRDVSEDMDVRLGLVDLMGGWETEDMKT